VVFVFLSLPFLSFYLSLEYKKYPDSLINFLLHHLLPLPFHTNRLYQKADVIMRAELAEKKRKPLSTIKMKKLKKEKKGVPYREAPPPIKSVAESVLKVTRGEPTEQMKKVILLADKVQVIEGNIKCSNGLIHVINDVLFR
jgi:hypothetical protein